MIGLAAVARRGGGWVPLVGLAALVANAVSLALPAVLGATVDALVSGADAGRWLTVAAVLVAIGMATDLVDAYAGAAAVARTSAWLRARFVRHVLAAGPEATRRFDTGDLVTRLSANCVDAAQAGRAAVLIVAELVPPVGSVVLLALIDPSLAVAFVGGLAVVAVVLRAFTVRTAEVLLGYQRVQGRLAARLTEALGGARTIAAAGTVQHEQRRVLQPLAELHGYGVRTWRVLARSVGQASVTGPLVLVAVLVAAGSALSERRITAGELFAAVQYAALGAGLGGLTGLLGGLARARAGVRRVAEVLVLPPTAHGTRVLPVGQGRLEFRGVTVTADDDRAPLLADVDLVVPGGAVAAVVGPSGAGKSVLAALAARLRDPDRGRVLLDGVALPELSRAALRSAVGCAFDRPVLVGPTLADAIGPGRGEHRVRAAARAARADAFVARLPEGYATAPADAPFSGGELQRLGLARAWPAERLLVLDDATSSLDMVTEMQIRDALAGTDRTRLVVTHRAGTAQRADLVVWLAAGRVRGIGTHEALWADPAYREVFA